MGGPMSPKDPYDQEIDALKRRYSELRRQSLQHQQAAPVGDELKRLAEQIEALEAEQGAAQSRDRPTSASTKSIAEAQASPAVHRSAPTGRSSSDLWVPDHAKPGPASEAPSVPDQTYSPEQKVSGITPESEREEIVPSSRNLIKVALLAAGLTAVSLWVALFSGESIAARLMGVIGVIFFGGGSSRFREAVVPETERKGIGSNLLGY